MPVGLPLAVISTALLLLLLRLLLLLLLLPLLPLLLELRMSSRSR